MADRYATGVLDTSAVMDLPVIDEAALPIRVTITAVALAELSQGPHLAAALHERSVGLERLQVVETVFRSPLPFDAAAARCCGSFVALVLEAGRAVRPRLIDLMIAATAAVQSLPLFTRHVADFEGLQSALEIVNV